MTEALTEIEFMDVWKQFPRAPRPTLAGLDLKVMSGTIHVLIGHSGAGKSVTIKHLLGLVDPDKGRIVVRGLEVGTLGQVGLRDLRRNYGMLFQNSALFDSLDVYENVAFPLREHRRDMKESDIEERVAFLLKQVKLEEAVHKMPAELSGGMKKRVGLARAIALDPKILLCDEPTTGLDPETSHVIDDLIQDTTRALKATALIISHDIRAALRIADFVSMIWEGRIVETARPADFVKSKNNVVQQFLKGAEIL
jgi:phospholipid/cholesterol/gamma-HCH transport system ATP-binding protein